MMMADSLFVQQQFLRSKALYCTYSLPVPLLPYCTHAKDSFQDSDPSIIDVFFFVLAGPCLSFCFVDCLSAVHGLRREASESRKASQAAGGTEISIRWLSHFLKRKKCSVHPNKRNHLSIYPPYPLTQSSFFLVCVKRKK